MLYWLVQSWNGDDPVLNYDGRIASFTINNIAALGASAGIYTRFYATTITGGPYYLWNTDEYAAYVSASKLYFVHSPKNGDEGIWSTPISANTTYRFVVVHNFTGVDSANPSFYLNRVAVTPTEESSPVDSNAHSASRLSVGSASYLAGWNAYGFKGYVAEMAIYSSLTSAVAQAISGVTRMRDAAAFPNCTNYWDFNCVAEGVSAITAVTLTPNSDDTYTWTTAAPAWSKINSDTAAGITCSKNDEGEVAIFGLTTTTLPSNADLYGFTARVKGNCEDASNGFNVSLEVNGVWQTDQSTGNLPSSTTYSSFLYFLNATPYAWTQAYVDALRVRLTPPASIGKDSELYVQYLEILALYMNPRIRDPIGGNHLVGSGATGKAEFFLPYR